MLKMTEGLVNKEVLQEKWINQCVQIRDAIMKISYILRERLGDEKFSPKMFDLTEEIIREALTSLSRKS